MYHQHGVFYDYHSLLLYSLLSIQQLEAHCHRQLYSIDIHEWRNLIDRILTQVFVGQGRNCKAYQLYRAFYFCKRQVYKLRLELVQHWECTANQDLNILFLDLNNLLYQLHIPHFHQQIFQFFDKKYKSWVIDHRVFDNNQYHILILVEYLNSAWIQLTVRWELLQFSPKNALID